MSYIKPTCSWETIYEGLPKAAELVGTPFQLPYVSSSSKPGVLAPCSPAVSPSPACHTSRLSLLPRGSLMCSEVGCHVWVCLQRFLVSKQTLSSGLLAFRKAASKHKLWWVFFAPDPGSLLLLLAVMAILQVWVGCSPVFMWGLAGIPCATSISPQFTACLCSWLSILAGTS